MTKMRKPEAAFEELELKGATKGKKGMYDDCDTNNRE